MNFEKITVYRLEDGTFSHAIIKTDLDELIYDNEEGLNKLLKKYADKNGISLDELKKEDFYEEALISKEKLIEEPKMEIKDEGLTDSEKDTLIRSIELDETKKKKRSKKGIIITFASVATAAVVALVGASHIKKYGNPFNGLKAHFNSNDKRVEQTYTPYNNGNTYYVDSNAKVNENYTFDQVMEGVMQRRPDTIDIIYKLSQKKTKDISMDDFLTAISDIARISDANMHQISKFINGGEIDSKEKVYNINLEDSFASKKDYYVVKYFREARDRIKDWAFNKNNRTMTRQEVTMLMGQYIEFITQGKSLSITVDGQSGLVNFYELSDMARATILNMGISIFTIDCNYSYSGWNQAQLGEVLEQYANATLNDIENYGIKAK